MKITKLVIKHFEIEQKEYGTETALHNVIFNVASEILRDLGIKNIDTK